MSKGGHCAKGIYIYIYIYIPGFGPGTANIDFGKHLIFLNLFACSGVLHPIRQVSHEIGLLFAKSLRIFDKFFSPLFAFAVHKQRIILKTLDISCLLTRALASLLVA